MYWRDEILEPGFVLGFEDGDGIFAVGRGLVLGEASSGDGGAKTLAGFQTVFDGGTGRGELVG